MKILYVNDFWEYGGAERIVQSLYFQSQARGNDTVFESSRTNIIPQILAGNFDIVHFHNMAAIGIEPLSFCINNKIPCLVTNHDYWPVCKSRDLYIDKDTNIEICRNDNFARCINCRHEMGYLPLPEQLAEIVNKVPIITVSQFQAFIIKRFEVYKNADIRVVHNGIDVSKWYNTGIYNYIFWFGLHKKDKNINVFHELKKQLEHKIQFIEVSTNPPDKGVPNRKSEEEIRELYSYCSIFLITSNWAETCGLSQLQAQASGKAVIGYNVGGISEYLPTDCGILVEVNDINALKQAIEKLVDAPEIAKKMGENGRRNISNNFTESIMWDNYNKIYQELIDKR